MPYPFQIPFWKKSPFVRIVLPFIMGILLQYYLQFSTEYIIFLWLFSASCFFGFYFLSVKYRYPYRFVQTILLKTIIMTTAMLLTWNKDVRNHDSWYGNIYRPGDRIILRLKEPPVEKNKTFNADCSAETILKSDTVIKVTGTITVYFQKMATDTLMKYGDIFITDVSLQEVRNSGNPGAFDYKQYLSFQQIYHTAYLKQQRFARLNFKEPNRFHAFIFSLRDSTLQILRKYLAGNNSVQGIAEALLIGFKEHLDKEIVQTYSNTGVVHIIAISGLHLGLIYLMLVAMLQRIPVIRRSPLLTSIIIIVCLWIFSLLTGASASVLRSAVMFTCIVSGKAFNKKSDIHNSLAVSAFLLLVYNPYYLWDAGFQLSYLAIISIVCFQQPIHKLVFFKSYIFRKTWELMAVTLAAQVLTFPICIHYFHQFPNFFFISNLIAVPLSTVILFAEIMLIAVAAFPVPAHYLGKLISVMIEAMNDTISFISNLPYSLWENIYASLYTTTVLYAIVICLGSWLLLKKKFYFKYAIGLVMIFAALHAVAGIQVVRQKRIVVYNIARQQAIDFICGNKAYFKGDSLSMNETIYSKHLRPARSFFQVNENIQSLSVGQIAPACINFFGKKIMIIDSSIFFTPTNQQVKIDFLVLSKNARVQIKELTTAILPSLIIFDASNSLWKIEQWKKECDALLLRCFSIPEKNAFVYQIE